MAIGFQLDEIEFSNETLNKAHAGAHEVAQIVTTFALIEGVVGGIYGLLKHHDIDTALSELGEIPSNFKRVTAVRNIIEPTLTGEAAKEADEIMKAVLKFAEKRNKVAHGVWGVKDGDPTILFRLPLKTYMKYVAGAVASGTKGDFMDRIDLLRAAVEPYRVDQLAQLRAEGEALLAPVHTLYNALGVIAAKSDGWSSPS